MWLFSCSQCLLRYHRISRLWLSRNAGNYARRSSSIVLERSRYTRRGVGVTRGPIGSKVGTLSGNLVFVGELAVILALWFGGASVKDRPSACLKEETKSRSETKQRNPHDAFGLVHYRLTAVFLVRKSR